ncbi:M1 family metallopeptidase [bacterium]|nr:MAG: M1 family metallopeptidase [bacterium]
MKAYLKKPARLPNHVVPSYYHIQITPNLTDFTFTGKEKIKLAINKQSDRIVLHSLDLNISSAKWESGKQEVVAKKISYNKKAETVQVFLPKKITGKGILHLEFSGTILDGLQGFYRSKYLHNDQEKHLATTQLEATDARRFFPCFDEPAHKAIFEMEAIVPKKLQVISNTIEDEILPHHDTGLKIVRFQPTPQMSTYLLALIIGELEHLQTQTKSGVQIRVHTTPGKKSQGKFALETTKNALEFLEDYFGIPYPLPVLDMIAIPDFAAGAMENWGAVTFREKELLVDDDHTPFIAKQRIAEVISHELVHQWFGNLVTMEWWTHLWLNESFACYMAYLVVDNLHPEWNFWTKFILQEQSYALNQDSLHTSHPIEVEVHHPNQIGEIFDGISYSKGASILRMLSSYIGEETFRKGLSLYLKKHSYKNTSSIHLWEAFEKASGKPVRKFMKRWTQEVGYPMVDVSLHNNRLLLTQNKFTQLPQRASKRQRSPVWSVPILPFYGKNVPTGDIELTRSSQSFPVPSNYQLIKLNDQEQSFFITNYDLPLLARLAQEVKAKEFSSVDRLAILRNTFLLAKAGKLSTDIFLELAKNLQQETSYVVWSEVAGSLNNLGQMLAGTSTEKFYNNFLSKIYGQLISKKELGFNAKDRETYNNKTLRGLAFLQSGLYGHKPSISAANQMFAQRLKGKATDPDTRLAVYATVARWGNAKAYQQLVALYKKVESAQEKQQLLLALTKFQQPELQRKVLKFFYGKEIRDQDRFLVINYSLQTSSLKKQAWKALQANWKNLERKYGSSKMLGSIISGASSFNSKQESNSFEKFVKTHDLSSAKQAVKQTREKIAIKLAWLKRDLGFVRAYLIKNQ